MPVPPAVGSADGPAGAGPPGAITAGGVDERPNRVITSARPSLFVSRNATIRGRDGAALGPGLRPLNVFTYTVPFGATTTCRAWPRLSAKIVAQNPGGRDRPALSPAQALFSALGVDGFGA